MPSYSNGPWAGIPFGALGPSPSTDPTRALPRGTRAPTIVDGDYILEDDGNFQEGDPVMEEVLFLLGTMAETFEAPDGTKRGNTVIRIQTFLDGTLFEVTDRVNLALVSAVNRGVIKDVLVTVAPYMQNQSTAVLQYLVSFRPTGQL